jgi:copper(I)-binding protein
VPAGGATLLKPGGLHLMLINLIQELQVGDMVDIVLVLSDDSTMELSVPVREAVENEMKENGK